MDHQQTVAQIYQAFGEGNIPGILALLEDDIVWEHGAQDHGIPWLKPGQGKAHVEAFFATIQRELEIRRFDISAQLSDPKRAVVVVQVELTVRATGKRVHDLELHLWTFHESGRISTFRHIVDTHQHWLASRA